jgi:hypothetical protein
LAYKLYPVLAIRFRFSFNQVLFTAKQAFLEGTYFYPYNSFQALLFIRSFQDFRT